MKQIHYIIEKLDTADSAHNDLRVILLKILYWIFKILRLFKFELLRILSSHEHWLPLCLPLLTDRFGCIMRNDNFSSLVSENSIFFLFFKKNLDSTKNLSTGFLSRFFSHIYFTSNTNSELNETDRCNIF